MLFSSPTFIVFFACYIVAHALTPARFRVYTMIAGSGVFYGYWNWTYTGLPFLLTVLTFVAVAWTMSSNTRKGRLAISIVALLTPLLFFKYTNFVWNDVIGGAARLAGASIGGQLLSVGLPLGISFVTFTLIAYLVDVATGKYPQQVSLRWLLGYVLFFPHLIAGPILRPHELIPQLQRGMPLLRRNVLPGLALFASGLVKKLVFADPIGAVVTSVYSEPASRTTAECLFALYGFSVQIYCDFSGYTDMALGLAMILGIRLPGNFLRPYLATSIADFWRRWHITLSHWLRDYVYIPLGGNRHGDAMTARNILVTMTLGGLWHGANWTFLIWGVLHGAGVAVSHFLARGVPSRFHPPRWLQIVLTFHIVTVLWVFFRAKDVHAAFDMLATCFSGWSFAGAPAFLTEHAFQIGLIVVFFLWHPWDDGRRLRIAARKYPAVIVAPVLIAACILAFTIGSERSGQFIYFEF